MRQVIRLNTQWLFQKGTELPIVMPQDWEAVTLPHTWNAQDGQDGGGDYYRGHGVYVRNVTRAELPEADQYYLEINGANSSADVYWNGAKAAHHDGGYSTWRVELTDIQEENLLIVDVDNSANERVYPQSADFTFYGGLYRNVNIIAVNEAHFDLEYYGSCGLKVTPDVEEKSVKIKAFVKGTKDGQSLHYVVKDAQGEVVGETTVPADNTKAKIVLDSIHLWHGRKDPYLYTVEAEIVENGEVLDDVKTRIGFRTFRIDPDNGFILTGEEYPLRGVSRHQDRWGVGNALLPEHHEEDIDLIMELGATTIRLAHYQHDQHFYDLCDEKGLVIWAEIPYISRHMEDGRANTISQMKELIAQNYHHASIVVWGLSNEITMNGNASQDLIDNHNQLNDLCHRWDKTRLTTMACITMASMEDPYVQIPDVVSYNHYFGWYGGDTSMNGPWFDKFHEKFPNKPIGCSEYGCEALNWHTSNPQQGDYTEEYQAYYHEELIKQLFTRKYMWATHVWNMFDFGCDNRNEGGENGQNHKGLVTIDRKYKKDAFYAYKAWLSDEPFVHICGKRYTDRVEDVTKVTVYSNLPEVELFANGVSLGKQNCPDHFFYFDVSNQGEQKLEAVAGEYRDESLMNWFDVTAPEGYYSINDKMGDIMTSLRGKLVLMQFAAKLMKGMKKDKKSGEKKGMGVDVGKMMKNGNMLQMVGGFTILRMSSMAGLAGVTMTKEMLLDVNAKLNKIKKKA